MNNQWGICCPGLSLSLKMTQGQIERAEDNHLVALNSAIFSDFEFDYWAMLDIEVFENCCLKAAHLLAGRLISGRKDTILWIPERWIKDIPRDYDPLKKVFSQFMKEIFSSRFFTAFPVGKGLKIQLPGDLHWQNYSLFVAIAMAISKGAKYINIYGADMRGEGYFKPGFRNGRTRHDEKRWAEESAIFNIIKYECKKRDIYIVRR